jgi:hypothetical protein
MRAMGEYGGAGAVSQGATGGGGGGGGNMFGDVASSVMSSLRDLMDTIVALPPLMLLGIVAVVVIGGLLVFRRV